MSGSSLALAAGLGTGSGLVACLIFISIRDRAPSCSPVAALPPPPALPPLSSSNGTTPRAIVGWTRHPRTNCYDGRGGSEYPSHLLRTPAQQGDTLPDAQQCLWRCHQHPGCTAVVVKRLPQRSSRVRCWLRSRVEVKKCESSKRFDSWSLCRPPLYVYELEDAFRDPTQVSQQGLEGLGASTTHAAWTLHEVPIMAVDQFALGQVQ